MNTEKLRAWLKKYWPWLAAGAGLLLVLYLMRRNQAAQSTSMVYGAQPQPGGGLSQGQIAANTQLETTRLTTQERLAEAQLSAQTAQIKAQLDAQTQQSRDTALAASTASQQRTALEAQQATQSGMTTRNLYDNIGRAIPALLSAFRPGPGNVVSMDTFSPTAAGQLQATGDALSGFGQFPGLAPGAGPSSGLPLPTIDPGMTQASTIILPTPTFDMQGPPLDALAGLGGVTAMPAWSSFANWGFG